MLKIAIPMAGNRLCMHFGHCEEFAFAEVDEAAGKIVRVTKAVPPPHEPGVIPRWIAASGAKVAIVGGMGSMAQQILDQLGVKVIAGAPAGTPEELVDSYLKGSLVCGENICDHSPEESTGGNCTQPPPAEPSLPAGFGIGRGQGGLGRGLGPGGGLGPGRGLGPGGGRGGWRR